MAPLGSTLSTASAPDDVLLVLAGTTCALLLARLALCAAVTTGALVLRDRSGGRGRSDRARGDQHPTRTARAALALSPRVLRPLVALALAGSLSLAAVAPAGAATGVDADRTGAPSTSQTTSVAARGLPPVVWQALPPAGWVPVRPRPAPTAAAADVHLVSSGRRHARPESAGAPPDHVVVRRGDTLWAVAARHLGAGSSDAEVAAQWPRWWRANRTAIGADPDVLVPGTQLVAPR